MNLIKQNDTTKPIVFLMVDSSNHITGKTGLTPSVSISKNGSAFTTPSGTVSELGYGWYKLSPASSDVDTLGPLILHAEAEGADPADVKYQVVAFDPYDQNAIGLVRLDGKISDIPQAIWSYQLEGSYTAGQILVISGAVLSGKISGADTNQITVYAFGGSNTTRLVASVDDYGNRTAITYYLP